MNHLRVRRPWRNWSGSVHCEPNFRATPVTLEDVQAEVLRAAEGGERLRTVGGGHSFTPLCWTDENQLSLDHFDGIESTDLAHRRVWVRAGTRMSALLEELAERGLALECVGDIEGQTVGGAVSTGAHGTGGSFGSLSTQVTALRLVAADGSVREMSAASGDGLFDAARLSLGALGVITHVELQCVEPYRLEWHCQRSTLYETLGRLPELRANHRHFEFLWYPYTDQTQLRWSDPTLERLRRLPAVQRARHWLADSGAGWAGAEVLRRLPFLAERVARYSARGAIEGNCVGHRHRSPRTRLLRYHEIEYSVPVERVPEVLLQVDRLVRALKLQAHLPLHVRFMGADDLWLSPAYRRDSACIAARASVRTPHADWFAAITDVLDRNDGRPHWAKLHDKTAHELRGLYARFNEFCALRSALDPRGVFLNPHLSTLFGVDLR